jgi:hypothetical protein
MTPGSGRTMVIEQTPEPEIDRIAERMGMPGLMAGATHHNC